MDSLKTDSGISSTDMDYITSDISYTSNSSSSLRFPPSTKRFGLINIV